MQLHTLKDKPYRIVAGLMSGTSADGIDTAIVRIRGHHTDTEVELLAYESFDYSQEDKAKLLKLVDYHTCGVPFVSYMNFHLGTLYANAVIELAKKSRIKLTDIDLVASHGQTVYHQPLAVEDLPLPNTLQIGDPSVIAQATGILTIGDFRVADVAAGGYGAPLVPYTEYLLYRQKEESIALQNIGGISNVTMIPKNCAIEDVFAFDNGPGNMVMDSIMHTLTKGAQSYDKGGAYGARGTVCEPLLDNLCEDQYFLTPPPKTTGREYFGKPYADNLIAMGKGLGLSDYDIVATATALTARSIYESYRRYVYGRSSVDKVVIGGGGSYNPTLMAMLKAYFAPVAVVTQEDLGYNSDAKEAIAFAILGNEVVCGHTNNLPSATNAEKDVIMGKICLP